MSRPGNRRPDVLPDLPPGARVVLVLPSGPDLAALLLECLDRHLVAVPLGPRTERWRIEEIVDRVGAAAVVTVDGTATTGRHTDRDDTRGLALVMFTSGSTGAPKGVMLPRDAVFANARATARLHGFTPDRPHATCLPLFHCNALVMSLVGTHLTGTPLVLHPRFDPEDYFADIARNGVRTASVVPSLLPDLLDAAPEWPEGLEYLITAAAPLTAEVAARFHELYGPRLRQGYGLTELMNFSFTTPVLDADRWRAEYLDGHPPVGEALPGTELRLEAGEVWIRSADRMRGYWDDPDATAAALTPDGWLRTGDLGRRRGDLLVLDGRSTERIDRGGEKFYPLDVERSWREAGLTGTFAAVGVPDDVLGHEIGLVTAENSAASRDAVRRIAEQGPMRPGAVALGGFAATSTGKPQRSAMGRALATGRVSAARLARSRDAVTAGAPGPGDRSHDGTVVAGERERLADLLVERLAAAGVPGDPVRLDLTEATDADRALDGAADRPVVVLHGPSSPGRWDLITALSAAGRDAVGAAVLRSGSHDLGGVVWAR